MHPCAGECIVRNCPGANTCVWIKRRIPLILFGILFLVAVIYGL